MKRTIYIAPGNSQCRVYVIPYPMRPGQHPRDIAEHYRRDWQEIGLLNFRLEIVCLEPEFSPYREDIAGSCGGTFFEIP